jgi:flagellar protein FliS
MTYSRVLDQYKKTHVETAGKLDLVLMCYEKAVEVIRQAGKLHEEKRFEEKAQRLKKAIDILTQLQSCLNFEGGGELARNLDSIYAYLIRRLVEGDLQKNISAFDEAVRILSELKEAWNQIATGQTLKAAPRRQTAGPERILVQLAA